MSTLPSHLANRTFNTLSDGEKQRIHFARALLQIWHPENSNEHRYLLLDEPISNLDLAHQLSVMRLSREVAERGNGVLIVLHDLNIAARFADFVVLLDRGQICSVGTPSDVFRSDMLTHVYGTSIHVEHHADLGRLVIYS